MVAWPVYWMLLAFYPFVWLLNGISNGLLRLFGVKLTGSMNESLSREELRSVVYETAGRISPQYQSMLLGILDLNKVGVEDVMVPGHEIIGIDLEDDWGDIHKQLIECEHDWVPVYRENLNKIEGLLHIRELIQNSLSGMVVDKANVLKILHEPYFIPEGTPLNIQLLNFQRQQKRFALVVDEYGEIQGLVTVEDILEEIVGEFKSTVTTADKMIEQQSDGSYLVDGAITIKELNRETQWALPTKGPRTLNGLIVEYLEAIPHPGVCVKIAQYPIEIVAVKDNRVKVARIFPSL
jgi:Mg2+/Co2+ transporter CorB